MFYTVHHLVLSVHTGLELAHDLEIFGVGTRPLRYGKTYQEKTVPDMLGAYIGNAPPVSLV